MKKLVVILIIGAAISACASLPSDVKDFVMEEAHTEIAVKCIVCHMNLSDSVN